MITIERESFAGAFIEFLGIIPTHWKELAEDQDTIPLNPLWEVYFAREAVGELFFMAVRKDGKLIGYFIAFICPGLHYRDCLTATMDIFYLHPSHRGGVTALKLFRAVLRDLRALKVNRVFLGTKLKKDAGRIYRALGFRPVDTYYSRLLEPMP